MIGSNVRTSAAAATLLLLAVHAGAQAPARESDRMEARKTRLQGVDMHYRLFKPANYDPAKKYPVVVSLHGVGERGSDNRRQVDLEDLAHPWIESGRGRGFGLGLSVLLDPAAIGRAGAAGQVGWTGSASTYFVIDPATGGIGLLMLQHIPGDADGELPRVALPFYNHVQQVLAR